MVRKSITDDQGSYEISMRAILSPKVMSWADAQKITLPDSEATTAR
jgi:hypothetical protein